MAKTGKGLPRSLQNVDFGTYKVVVHDVYGNIISSSTVATVS